MARDFDADAFADRFAKASIDSVTVFGLCHHGHAYFRTSHPCRHPALPDDLDLTGAQIDALHRRGIRAPIYLSGQVNEYAADEHPEWVAVDPEGRRVKRLPADPPPRPPEALVAGWQILDMSSPYQDYLADLVEEVLRRYAPVDGIFLDMCWDQPSVSKWALAGMAKRRLDPRSEADRDRHAREVAMAYMKRFSGMVEAAGADADHLGIWFNSRPKTNLHVEKRFLRHIEIEALPTGGWGYAYFPYVARFVRPLGLPTLSHTGRFFKSWGDNAGLKPRAALKYECCQILSQGMALGVGDLLHPRGVPDPAVYDLIGEAYRYIERCQEVAAGGRLQSEIAVVVDPDLGDRPGPAGLGATCALQQLRLQFDVVPPTARLQRYPVVVVLSNTPVDEGLRAALRDYVAGGGCLMLCGAVALAPDGAPLLAEQGIETHGPSPYRTTFLRPSRRRVGRAGRLRPRLLRAWFPHGAGRRRPLAGPRRGAVLRAVRTTASPGTRIRRPDGCRATPRSCSIAWRPAAPCSPHRHRCCSPPTAATPCPSTGGLIGNCLALLMPRPLSARSGGAERAGDHRAQEGRRHHRAPAELRARAARRPGHRRGRPAAGGPAGLNPHGPPAAARRARPARRAAGPRVPRRLRHGARHPARRPRQCWCADDHDALRLVERGLLPAVDRPAGGDRVRRAESTLHWDLYLRTHAHRMQHGPECEAYPSPPSRAPLWAILAEQMPIPPESDRRDRHRHRLRNCADRRSVCPARGCSPSSTTPTTAGSPNKPSRDAGVADRVTIAPSMDEAPFERSDLVFRRRTPSVDPSRSARGLSADRRRRENAPSAAPQSLPWSRCVTRPATRMRRYNLARQRYRAAAGRATAHDAQ